METAEVWGPFANTRKPAPRKHSSIASYRKKDELIVPFHAGVHQASHSSVPKAADDQEHAYCHHASTECLCQVYITGYNTPGDEEVE